MRIFMWGFSGQSVPKCHTCGFQNSLELNTDNLKCFEISYRWRPRSKRVCKLQLSFIKPFQGRRLIFLVGIGKKIVLLDTLWIIGIGIAAIAVAGFILFFGL